MLEILETTAIAVRNDLMVIFHQNVFGIIFFILRSI